MENGKILDCNAVTLAEILERTYSVPLYQRPYEWTNSQLEKLYEEVDALFDESGKVNKTDFLFFGSLQFNKTNQNYEVVDGQQRLISFVLLMSAMQGERYVFKDNILAFGKFSMRFENNVKEEVIKRNYEYYCSRDKREISNVFNNIYFAEVVTNEINDIEKLLNIFNAMNMEGLPLQREDVFKTKCASYFNGASSEEIIACINEQYRKIYDYNLKSKTCDISEYNLIDTFRYYMIQQVTEIQNANSMKENPISLLTRTEFADEQKSDIKVFEEIANTIIKTQELIDAKNNMPFDVGMEIWFARELIGESRYWNLRNIMYYIVYKNCKVKGEPTEEEVIGSLKISEKIWQFCSIYRAGAAKVVNEVYNRIIEKIIKPETIEWDCYYLSNANEYFNRFAECFDKCFNSNLPHLLTILSYFDDSVCHNQECCEDEKVSIGKMKEQIFYRELNFDKRNRHIEIEHIISQTWSEELDDVNKPLIDSIGNLMYLERNINRAIGDQLGKKKGKSIINYKDDIEILKQNTKNEERLSYKNSNLVCVKEVVALVSEDWLQIIKKRKEDKIAYIRKLYNIETNT